MTRRLTAIAAALALGLTACSGTDPATEPPPTVDVGGKTSDGGGEGPSDGGEDETNADAPNIPDIPEPDPADFAGMDEETPEGAEQTYKYYWELMLWGLQTGETEELSSRTGDPCDVCNDNIETIQIIAAEGAFWSRTESEERTVETTNGTDGYQYIVKYGFYVSAHTIPDLDGGNRTEEPRLHYATSGGMNWEDGQWVINGMALSHESIEVD